MFIFQPGFRFNDPRNFRGFGFPGLKREPSQNPFFVKLAELHKQAVDGDKDAVNIAYYLLERVRRFYPQSNIIEAYYGSVLTLQGRDAVDPLERLEKARQGLKYLDDAVVNEPDNTEIRILRGYICCRLPEVFFHRTVTSVEDFKYLISRYQKEPGIFSAELYNQLLHDLESCYQTLGYDENPVDQ